MLSSLLSLSLAALAFAEQNQIPGDCKNVAAYDARLQDSGGSSVLLKLCVEDVAALNAAMTEWQAARQQSVRGASLSPGGTQADAQNNTAAMVNAGAAADQNLAKAAATAQSKFDAITAGANEQVKFLDKQIQGILLLGSLSPVQKDQFRNLSGAARNDLVAVAGGAHQLSAQASQYAGQLRGNAEALVSQGSIAQGRGRNLTGNSQDAVTGAIGSEENPLNVKEVGATQNTLIGLGGAALITAGAVGGLYWVAQSSIKSVNSAAAARITQAQNAANNVINTAQGAAQNIIQFATNSANQIIANTAAAANAIYNQAKADLNSLQTNLTNEVTAQLKNLTTAGLTALQGELSSMFNGLIARANSEGNPTLAAGLQNTLNQLNGQISGEINRRGTGTSSTATSTATNSSATTNSNTTTTTTTNTSTATSVSTVTRIGL